MIEFKETLTTLGSVSLSQPADNINEVLQQIKPIYLENTIKQNELKRKDNYVLYYKTHFETFYQMEREAKSYNTFPNTLLTQNIAIHQDTVSHTREVYNILDYLGDVGGLLDGI